MQAVRRNVFGLVPRLRVSGSARTTLRFFADEAKPEGSADQQQAAQPDHAKTIAEQAEKIKELEDKYMRALANTENVRARSKNDVQAAKDFGIQQFAKDLLQINDILQMATDNVPKDQVTDANPALKTLFEGLTSTQQLMLKTFNKHGLVQMDPLGQKFDPNMHEAQFEIPDPSKEAGTVAAVTKAGFTLNGRCIRAAGVGVVKKR